MTTTTPMVMPDLCSRRHRFHFTTALNMLMKMGIDINRVDILAVGEYENYKGEIRKQSPPPGAPLDDDTRIVLEIGYFSAVDCLPYQMFYGILGVTSRTTEWEDKARAFMAPFDTAVLRHEAISRHLLLKFIFGLTDFKHLTNYLKLFNFLLWEDSHNTREALLWSVLLPSFHFWAGNPDSVGKILHYLFGYDFQIIEGSESEYNIPGNLRTHLGVRLSRVGKEVVLGRSFKECDSSYEVRISQVKAEEVEDLLPGKPKRRKLEWALSICMPNNLDYNVTIKIDTRNFVLGTQGDRRFLGYSTYI
ncbi:MAG: type VI secretion system baseplate subunit TssG [Candidatus Zixiibacteriota bacterium]